MGAPASPILIVPSFHYDVAYLKSCDEYFPICFKILDEALRILDMSPQYRFLIEQVFLLEEYWNRFPEKREPLRRFAGQGRLAVAPGMYVMPDMNHPCGESMFRQAKIGKKWLRENLGLDPDVCWIADCWGHHAQLPQILSQCGYTYYVFWRCMRRDVMRGDFHWEGLDGTRIRTHWLARGYGNLRFPTEAEIVNALDLNLAGCGPAQIETLCAELQQYGASSSVMLCNGGDFMLPQASAPVTVERLNASGALPPVRFATPSDHLAGVDWDKAPTFPGEFNSAFQGSFTSNIAIKQRNRTLVNRLLALETLSVAAGQPRDYESIWRVLLKQQFHDIACGTICDQALRDCMAEFDDAAARIVAETSEFESPRGKPALFNPLSFERTENVIHQGKLTTVVMPPLGFADLGAAKVLPAPEPAPLPRAFETTRYHAGIGADGYVTSLIEKSSGQQLARGKPCAFGGLGMQMDYGDLWLNFDSPISGGSTESALTQNNPDPYDRSQPNELVNRGTFRPSGVTAKAFARGDEELLVEQTGTLSFWRLRVPFTTRVCFAKHSARIEYETTIEPSGRHYRLRAAFPTTIAGGCIRHEIPFGIQERGEAEHAAQNWVDYSSTAGGLALLNAGTPANNVDHGILLLTLFRSAAMEYKTESELSFQEGVPHTFRYAIVPHGDSEETLIVRNGWAFNRPPVPCAIDTHLLAPPNWRIEGSDNILLSALRANGNDVFVRVYECAGREAKGTIHVPPAFTALARTDGLEQPVEEFRPCAGSIACELKPFEVRGFLLQRT